MIMCRPVVLDQPRCRLGRHTANRETRIAVSFRRGPNAIRYRDNAQRGSATGPRLARTGSASPPAACRGRAIRVASQGRAGQRRPSKFLEAHRLAEQVSLDPVETDLVRRGKISAGFHALGNDTGAVLSGQFDEVAAHRALEPVIGAARDELS